MTRGYFAALGSLLLFSHGAMADVNCTITDFTIDAYAHKGTYLHGKLNGTSVSFIVICGITNSQSDCDSKATDRRLAMALAAQASGKSLVGYFVGFSSCSSVTPYTTVHSLQISP